jgi:hypothetical protein
MNVAKKNILVCVLHRFRCCQDFIVVCEIEKSQINCYSSFWSKIYHLLLLCRRRCECHRSLSSEFLHHCHEFSFWVLLKSWVMFDAKIVLIAEIFFEISYFIVIRIVCLFDFDVVNLLENCSNDDVFEFRFVNFAVCIWDIEDERRTKCKNRNRSREFDYECLCNRWMLEFSMKSRIEFDRVDFKLDAFDVENARSTSKDL